MAFIPSLPSKHWIVHCLFDNCFCLCLLILLFLIRICLVHLPVRQISLQILPIIPRLLINKEILYHLLVPSLLQSGFRLSCFWWLQQFLLPSNFHICPPYFSIVAQSCNTGYLSSVHLHSFSFALQIIMSL